MPSMNAHASANVALSSISSQVNTVYLSTFILSSNEWIIDSGATDHITAYLHILENPVVVNSLIHLPNGGTSVITHKGQVTLTLDIILTDVLCVP